MSEEKKNYGLKIVPRDPLDYEHRLGSSLIHKVVRRPDGQWIHDLPEGEIQKKNNVETFSCVSFGTLNIAAILEKVKFGSVSDYSDRFLAIASDTQSDGNDPKKVSQTFRDAGAIPEETFPFSADIKSFDAYHSPKPLPAKYKDAGKRWLENYEVGYEWVKTEPETLMEELQFGPVGIAVEAWKQDDKGLYYGGENPNHWTVLVGYIKDRHWIVYDSYHEISGRFGSPYIKLLRWDYRFAFAMSYSLNKKEQSAQGKKNEGGLAYNIFALIRYWIREILK